MANSKSQQYEIIKNGPLCLDKYCADVVPFGQGFNKKNSPLLGGAISNVFSKENSNISQYVSNGNHEAWLGTDNYIYIDGKKTQRNISSTENYRFEVEPIPGIDESYLDYWDEDTYLRVIDNNRTLEYKLGDSVHTINYDISHTYKIIERKDHIKFLVDIITVIDTNTSTIDININIYNSSGQVKYTHDKLFSTAGTVSYAIPVKYRNLIIRFGKFSDSTDTYALLLYLTDDAGNLYCGKPGADFEYSCGYIFLREGNWKYITSLDFQTEYNGTGLTYNRVFLYQDFTGYIEAAGVYCTWPMPHTDEHFCMCTNSSIIKTTEDNIEYLAFSSENVLGSIRNADTILDPHACVYTSPLIENLPGFRVIFKNHTSNNKHSFIFCKDIIWGSVYSYGYTDDYNLSALVGNLITEDEVIPKPAFNKRLTVDSWLQYGLTYFYEVLVDKNNKIQSFSFTSGIRDVKIDYTSSNIGTLLVPIGSVSNERPFHTIPESEGIIDNSALIYFDAYDKIWKKISIKRNIKLAIVDDYLLINTTSRYNAININDLTDQIWANDWNNRFVRCSGTYSGDEQVDGHYFRSTIYGFLRYDNFFASKKEIKLSSAYNYSITSSDIPSSQLPEDTVYLYTTLVSDLSKATPDETYYYNLDHMGSGCDIYDLEIYKNGRYNNSIFTHIALTFNESYNVKSEYLINPDLIGTTYLVDSLYYTPAITMKLKETYSNRNLVSFDNLTYSLQYYGDIRKEKLLYALSTQYYGIENIFIIQGQGYFTQNNKIYSFTVSADYSIIESVNFITNIQGLTFKANTTKMAYFWSKNDSSLYVFTADNVLGKLYTATDITDIYDAIYYPSLDATVFDTNIGLLCLNDNFGMFCINNTNNGNLYLNPNGYITLFSNKLYYYNLWFLDDTWAKNDVILSTKFYGLGSNMISITDTWYFRLFADKSLYEQMDISRSGKLKLSIDALTDQGMSTEVKEIDIKESDWDELTDTLYIRYQPKLQRGVGISLNVESPFAIGYLGLGNIMETTQMSRPSMQV